MESLIRAPHNIQSQLGEVFKSLVYNDFPDKWPALLPALLANLSSPDQTRVHGALFCFRILARKYEFRDEDERGPLDEAMGTAFPILLHLFNQLLASTATTPDVPEYIKLICKTLWSATYMNIPAVLLQREQFMGWMSCLHTAMIKPVPAEAVPADPRDRAAHPWWKAKKWVFHVSYRLINRYGIPKDAKEGNDKTFSEMFARECAATFLEAELQVLSSYVGGTYVSPRCLNLLLQFVRQALGIKALYKQYAEHWDKLLMGVAFPLMCFNDEDAELWRDDPQEYIRKGYDILEDMYSPRTAAGNFAHELCKRKSHRDVFMAQVAALLSGYSQAAAAGTATQADARRMDGALVAIGMLSEHLRSKSPYKEQLGPMLLNFVVPCFKSPYGHLRAKACWACGLYCTAEFGEGKTQESYALLLQQVLACLNDPELPVRVDAAVAVKNFVEEVESVELLKPILPQLLNSIFALMGQVDNEDLVVTLEVIVERFGEDIAPYALQMVQQLSAAFWKYVTPHEEGEEDDEMASIAAYTCLSTINTLLDSVSSIPDLFPHMEEALFPILQKMISVDGQDVMEMVLDMLAYINYYGKGISERLWSLWPQLEEAVCSWASDYWFNFIIVFDNYIGKDTRRFVECKSPDYLASVFKMMSFTLTEDIGDEEAVHALRLMEVVLQYCRGAVDPYVGPYLQLALARGAKATTNKFKDAVLLVVANAMHYNAALTLTALQQQGALVDVLTAWFGRIHAARGDGGFKYFRRMHDKKVCVLGLVALMTAPDEVLPPQVQAGMPQILGGLVRLLVALKQQKEEADRLAEMTSDEEEEDEEDEDEDGDEEEEVDKAAKKDDAEAEAYLNRLAREARKLTGGDGDDDDDDDEWTDDEEVETPIDPLDPWVVAADTLAAMQATNPGRHHLLASGATPEVQQGLAGLMQYAEQRRAELAKQQAA
mmetsp:Transcript_35700/g.79404  ORF Transcript_35700/g.79404 Transcript_35700/m.79404 type:complete len:941 (+) Transcript_35700:266-3088(+)